MKWKLVQQACGDAEIIEKPDTEDLRLGLSLMRELAESDATLVEVEPGVWRQTGSYPGNSGPGA